MRRVIPARLLFPPFTLCSHSSPHSHATCPQPLFAKFGPLGVRFYFYDTFRKLLFLVILAFTGKGSAATAQSVIVSTIWFVQCVYVMSFLPFQGMMGNLGETVVEWGQSMTLGLPILAHFGCIGYEKMEGTMMLVMTLSTAFNVLRVVIELPATVLAPIIWFLKKTWAIDFIYVKADETVLDHVVRARDEVRERLTEPAARALFDEANRAERNNTKYNSKKAARDAGRREGVKVLALHFDYAPSFAAPDKWWVPKCLRCVVRPVSSTCLRRVVGAESTVAKGIGLQVKKAMQELKDTQMLAAMFKKYCTRCHWAKYVPGIPTAVRLVMQYALNFSLDNLIAELVTDAIDQMSGTDGEDEDHAPAWLVRAEPEDDAIEILEISWINPLEVETVEPDSFEVEERPGELCGICHDHEGEYDESLSFAGCGFGQLAASPEDDDLDAEVKVTWINDVDA